MSLSDLPTKYRYQGNGVTDTFAYSSKAFGASFLVVQLITRATDVVVETLTINTEYSVTILTNGTASITVAPSKIPTATQDILIYLSLPLTQTVELPSGTSFDTIQVETALDKNVALIQAAYDILGRSLTVPEAEIVGTTSLEIPAVGDRANKYLAFDASGNLTSTSGTTTVPVSTTMEDFVGSSSLALARSELGVYSTTDIDLAFYSITDIDFAFYVLRSTLSQVNDFRLTLTTATPVTTADVTGASTIYCTPYKGNKIALFDGTDWVLRSSAEFSLAIGTLANTYPHDVFCYDDSGTPTLELLSWTNDTTRATALAYQDGVLSKTGALTRRYLGTIKPTATTTTEDSAANRFLFNYYNRVRKTLYVTESTATWTYSTAAYRQAKANAANKVSVMIGVAEEAVNLACQASVSNSSTTTRAAAIAIGYDSVSAAVSKLQYINILNLSGSASVNLNHYPGIGSHYYSWLEYGAGVDTQTWYGPTSGLTGSIII